MKKLRLLQLLSALTASYILINWVTIKFVPIVHRIKLDFSVYDPDLDIPVSGVNIAWIHINPTSKYEWTTPAGLTDDKGRFSCNLMIQEQPSWAYPTIGSFRFHNKTLELTKHGHVQRVPLSNVLSSIPYSTTAIEVRLAFKRGP
jgi:hypothetical protein